MKIRHLIDRARILASELSDTVRKAAQTQPSAAGSIQAICLEERVMMSASPIAEMVDVPASFSAAESTVADSFNSPDAADQDAASQTGSNLVFVDASVPDYGQLIAELGSDPSENMQIIVLHSDRDGIEQITSALAGRSGIESIHIVSHGNDGNIQLGNTLLSSRTLDAYAGEIALWQSSLSADADLLLYGCNLAATEDGQGLLEQIGGLTGADVAASDNLTGSVDLGGDWELEYRLGDVTTATAFGYAAQSSWYGTLDIASGLVLHNTFDANASDSSGNNYNGTLTNGALINTTSATNNIGPGKLFLDGTNDYVDFSSHVAGFQGLTQGTISAWVYANSDRDVIFELSDSGDNDSRLALFRDADGSFDFYVREGSTTLLDVSTAAGAIAGNTWTHVAVTVDASGNKLYVNGVQQGVTYATGSATTNPFFDDVTQLDFAAWGVDKYSGSSFTRYFNGMLDDGRVYNRALTGSDITELSDYTGLTPTSLISVTNTLDNINGNTLGLAQLIADDGGDGISLREAIAAANNQSGLDTINFNIAAALVGGTHTINISTALPTIGDAVIINGLSEPDYVSGTPVVRIDGAAAGFSGISIGAGGGGSTIQGLRITGFTLDGINIASLANNVTIADNWIGTNGTGTSGHGNANVGNSDDGIEIAGSNALILRNVITNNNDEGVDIKGSGVTGHVIQGNIIGLDPDGSTGGGNFDVGIAVYTGSGNTIGGTSVAARNVISRNNEGIEIRTSDNVVQGNYIGTDVTGAQNRGNLVAHGVQIQNSSTNNLIGGMETGAGNLIAFNAGNGVEVVDGSGNSILRNSIHSNTGLAIDLGANGLTYNDINDVDAGGNGLLNFPILKTAVSSGGNTTVSGAVRGLASTTFRVEFFSNPYGSQETTGYGEARIYLGATTVTTDAGGKATFSALLNGVTLQTGATVTATATVDLGGGSYGSTSEFAGNILSNQPNLMISGTYTGTGADNRTIAGLGFRPDLVMVFSEGANIAAIRSSDMVGDVTKSMTGATALAADRIQSLTADGFTIGTNAQVNTNAVVYHWVAFGAGADIDFGAFTGNGTSQSVTGMGFAPEYVMTMSATAQAPLFRSSLHANSFDFNNSGGVATGITSLNADGFSVGSSGGANQSGSAMYYVAFNQNASYFALNSYSGDSTDNRNITGIGFEPELVFVKRVDAADQVAFKSESTGYNVDKSVFGYGSAQSPNYVQNLQSNGFQVGTNARVNQAAATYNYFAFRQTDAPLVVDTTSDTSDGTVTSINNLRANKGADGFISLREALAAANATHNGTIIDTIQFNIAGLGVHTINLTAAFPDITDAIFLDGWSEPDYVSTPVIELNGSAAGGGDGLKLTSTTANSTVRGFIINRFGDDAIQVGGSNTTIVGNYIGTNAAGTAALANLDDGINIDPASLNNIIGGTTAAERNVISGNLGEGIHVSAGSTGNLILGNYIGLNAAGTTALANSLHGINLLGGSTTIGGTAAGARNVISGNTLQGIFLDNSDNNTIQGNYVGTNAAGIGDVNGTGSSGSQSGIVITNGSSGNVVGGTAAGARNVLSGNNWFGLEFLNAGTDNNTVQGNYIGTDYTGLVALGNTQGGVSIYRTSNSNVIGGIVAAARNIISGNLGNGIYMGSDGSGPANNKIQGNYIGLDATGSAPLGNAGIGIYVTVGTGTIIGTDADSTNDAAERNVIAGNSNGIVIEGAGSTGTSIAGNYVGTDATGLIDLGNTFDGLRLLSGATGNTIGGTTATHRNIIAGNNGDGIEINGETSDGNFIYSNWIGLGSDGTTVLGNGNSGVLISGGADNTTIGGIGTGNVIVGSLHSGIAIDGASSGTVVYGNYLGINAAGTVVAGNAERGILLANGATNNTIGGTTAGQGNTITASGLGGVYTAGIEVAPSALTGNTIAGNSIYGNFGLGIDLGVSGVNANDNLDPDTGANNLQNFPVITAATTNGTNVVISGTVNTLASVTGLILHFYATPNTGDVNRRDGRRYLGSTTVNTDGSGNATFTNISLSSTVAVGEVITVTASSPTVNSDTSEFSQGVVATATSGNSAPTSTQAISTTGGGLNLNTDGGNDAYLLAENGANLVGGRTQLSVEIQFSSTNAAAIGEERNLFSYASTVSSNDFRVAVRHPSAISHVLDIYVNGASVNATGFDASVLFDGASHSIGFTWSNVVGEYAIYVDGALVTSGTGFRTAASIGTGGVLVLGGEQDSVGGGFDPAQVFKGTYRDVRLFSDVRTATEMASSWNATLPHNEGGLIANWRFDDLSTAGVTTDSVGGNNLAVTHGTGTGFTASSPTLSFQVNESSAIGTIVGTVYGTDLDRESKITQLLANDPTLRYSAETGKFYKLINGGSTWAAAQTTAIGTTLGGVAGQLVTINSAAENDLIQQFAISMSSNVWLGASDQSVEGQWRWYNGPTAGSQFWQGLTSGYAIDGAYENWLVGEPNDAGGNEDAAYLEIDGTWNDAPTTANYPDIVVEWNADDVLDATHALTYSIQSQTVAGAFAINGDTGMITVADGSGLNYESNPTHTVTVRVSDGLLTYDKAFTISLNNVAIEPTNSVPGAQSTNEDTSLVFSSGNGNAITVTDSNAATNSLLQVSLSIADGTLTLSGTTGLTFVSGANGGGSMVINGTESDINAALNGLTFSPASDYSGSVNLQIATSPTANLEGWYSFDGGNANDVSAGTANHGTLFGNATTISDPTRGTVLSLDGVGDYAQISGVFGQPANATLAAWVNLNQASLNGSEVISLGDSLVLRMDEAGGGGVTGMFYNGTTWVSINTQRLIAGTGWHHVAFTFDDVNNVQRVYIDGELAATANNTQSITWFGGDTFIGRHGGGTNPNWDFNGKIDEARIITRALSASEIASLAAGQYTDYDTVAITVNPVNDEQVLATNSGLTVAENSTGNVIDNTRLLTTDVDNTPGQLVYTVTTATSNGTLRRSGSALGVSSTFTQADINSGLITYDHNGGETASDSFSFSVDDGTGSASTGTFNISITPVNDNSPVITSNAGGPTASINVAENTTAVTTVTATDSDLPAPMLTYSITGGADSSRFTIDSSTGVLTFVSAPDYENPTDLGNNNGYEVIVQVSDGLFTDSQTITVTVGNVADGIRVIPISVNAIGSETLVNSTTADIQSINPNVAQAIATDANGNYIVVWASNLQDGDLYGIYAQRYDASGTALGAEFRINSTTADSQFNPGVAMDGAGNFVVTWASNLQDGSGSGIYAQRYNAAGIPQGTEFLVNTTTANGQSTPAIAMAANGSFAITWTGGGQDPDGSSGIYAQRFDASGVAQGGEFRVNTYTTGVQQLTSIGMDNAGNFVIIWASDGQDGSLYGVYGQRFNAAGVAQGAEFQVNSTTADTQLYHDIAMLDDGRFVVAFQSRSGATYEVYLQRYAADGTAIGGEIRANSTTVSGFQPIPSITADASGNMTVVWNSSADGSGAGVFGQRLDWSGTLIGAEFQVNSTSSGNQQYAEVAAQGGGRFVVAWGGNGAGDTDGIFMQRYGLTTTEGGGTATFQIVLEIAPTANVTIPIMVSDGSEGSVSVGSVTFTTLNWNVPQIVTITGLQDYLNDGDQTYQIQLGAATSTDLNFDGLDADDLTIINHEIPNTAPVNSIPAAQSTNEDTNLVFSSGNGNLISISDADAGNGTVNVLLSATNGTITLNGTTGLSFITGDGVADALLNFTGTIANINTALNGLVFAPTANYNGAASLQIITGDMGNSGTGGPLADSDTVNITVNSAADYPSGTDNTVTTIEDTDYVFAVADFGFTDPDAGDSMSGVLINTLPAAGTLRLNGTALTGVTFVLVTDINSGLLVYTPAQDGNGTSYASFTFTVIDSLVLLDPTPNTMTIDVTAVNDEEVLSANTGATIPEGSTGNVVTTAMLQTTDVDHTTGQLTYTVTSATVNGTLRRNGIALAVSSTFTQADIDAGLITYDQNGSETSSDSFSFSVDDGAGSASTGTFNITVTPVNDNTPTITSNGGAGTASINVAENSTAVTTVTATDADLPGQTLTFSISGVDAGLFSIDSNTGVLEFTSGRNRESHTDFDSNGIYEVTVEVSDGTLTDSQAISVTITDVDEFDVTNPADVNAAANTVNENAANGTVVGVTSNAGDADATTNTVTYSLTDDAGGRFAIDANTGVVTVTDGSLLNREAAALHNITVRATSTDTSTADTVFTINVNDVDEFDVTNPADVNAAANTVNENAVNGTVVGVTANASDADATTNTVTYSLFDSAGGRFAIDANTGVVTVADGSLLNREAAASHNITVRATSTDTSTADTVFTITVNDLDEFDVTNPMDTNPAANAVNENAANGTVVGVTASASDADATNNTVTYSLTDDAGGRFAIDANTGVVTVADGSLLNREAAASHNITVRATSSDTSTADTVFTININDVDEFDVGTVTDVNNAANSVAEDATIGTTVGVTAFASDADATTNTIMYTLDDNAGGRFAIDANTGVVTVASALDYETNTSHNVTVRANSADGSFSTQVFTISVTNVNEGGVGPVSDTNAAANNVAENSAVGTAVGVTANAVDPDITDIVTYLLDDNAGGRFAIDANTGVVTVASGIDREAAGSYNITIRATSSDTSFTTLTLAITISDADEFDVTNPADVNGAANAVDENAANGTVVGVTANASDADATTNTVTYSLFNNAGGRFAIDANTGVVTVADGTLLNREAAASHNITVRATSSDGSTADTGFTINLNDVDEFDVTTPVDSNAAGNTVAEDASVGTTVGLTASASDADATNNTITYSLDDSAGGRFSIDGSTGVVTVAGALDYETSTSHSVTVRATSADGSFATQNFTISVTNVNDGGVGPVSDANAAANSVIENAAIGTTVGVAASAADPDATDTISYTLDDDASGRFAIDANTGVVTVAGGIDREAAGSYSITIRATSSDSSFTTLTLSINITDVDEFDVTTPVDGNAAADTVNENAANGTVVGVTASASDADAMNSTVTYSLVDDAGGRFAIDANTGVVTVADGTLLNREAAASHNITVRATSFDTSTADTAFTITVNDVDEFDVTNPIDTNPALNAVNENAANGTVVGVTASASDADATNNTVTYSLLDDAGGRFAIDANTGVVTVADGSLLNREAAASHNIIVRATSTDTSTADTVFTITVNDVDEFDVTNPVDTNPAANAVNENAANGTAVDVTANASDADATTNAVTYSLFDNAGGRFAIDANTGVVTVADGTLLNREAAASHNITVRATSADGSTGDTVVTINLNDVDEFDVTNPVDINAAANAVNENAANGTVVGVTANASDADATSNTITYSLTSNPDGLFQIDVNTGVVTTGSALDRETHGASRNITVQATSSDGSTATQNFMITINDLNEFNVTVPVDADASLNSVAENATSGTVIGITAFAEDLDSTNNTITYTLDDDAGGLFAIDGVTGVVSVNGTLDYETATSHNIVVRASSSDGSSNTQLFTINVTNVNESGVTAISDTDAAADFVLENVSVGTVVDLTAFADDLDATDTVSYSLDDNAGGLFAIDSTTGVVTVAGAIDRETAASYNITVRATSTDTSTITRVFTIAIGDVDEFNVSIPTDSNAAANTVDENVAIGTTVGLTANAFDLDATNNTITYSLTSNPDGLFQIDVNTGVVTTAAAIDRETHGGSRNITVQSTSSDGSTATQNFTITINDLNEFGVSTPTDSNAAANTVDENVIIGTTVGLTANAFDLDATNNTITYSLTSNPDGLFQIDVNTGVVTIAAAIDRETHGASRNITIQATSSDGSTATQNFTITINDLNEFGVSTPTDSNAAANTVDENVITGTTVGLTANAFDLDATNNTITYSLTSNPGGLFQIDANTGVVTTAATIDRETHGALRSITVQAASSDGSTASQSFNIAINDFDEFNVSVPTDTEAAVNEVDENVATGTAVGLTANAFDLDATNNAIFYSLVDDDGGRFSIDTTTGIVSTAGMLDFESEGPVRSVTVRATGADGSYSDQVFGITIHDVNEAPTVLLANQTATLAENTNTSAGIKIADILIGDDALGTNLLSLSGTDAGSFEIVAGELRLRAGVLLDFETKTQYDLIVSVDDPGSGATPDDSVSYTLSISDLDDTAPVIQIGQMFVVDENSPISTILGSVIATDTDTTSPLLGWTIVAGNDDNHFAIRAADGTITVANNTNLNFELRSTYILTLTVSDGVQFSSPETIVIRVNNINEAPAAAAETFVTGQFEGILAMQPGVLANDFDEDGDALSAVLVAGPAHGTLILNPDGSFQYSPIGNFFGTDSFVYLASDGLLASGLAMVEVIVTPLGTPTGPSGGGGPANPPGVVVTTVTVGTAIDSSLDPDGGLNPDAVDGSSLRKVKFNSLFNAAGDIIAPSDADEVLLEAVEADVSTESRNPFDYLRRKLQGLNSPAANRLSNSLDSFEALVSMPLNWLQSEQGFADQGAAFSYQEFVVGSSAITTTSLTVGYAFWLIRGGSLVASFVSSLPAWTSFDPLSIVKEFEEDHDSESLLNIVEQSGNNGCRQA